MCLSVISVPNFSSFMFSDLYFGCRGSLSLTLLSPSGHDFGHGFGMRVFVGYIYSKPLVLRSGLNLLNLLVVGSRFSPFEELTYIPGFHLQK